MEEYWRNTDLQDLEGEVWKDVVGYEGLYQVSNLGRVKSLEREVWNHQGYTTKKERILKQSFDSKKYLIVRLCNRDNQPCFKVHRLVTKAFIPNLENKPFIDHINTIRTDNRVGNLRWCTAHENNINPLTRKHRSEGLKGRDVWMSGKFSKDCPNSIPIVQLTKNEQYIRTWNCSLDAQRELGILHSSISNNLKGRSKSAGGFKWVYLSEYQQ